MSVALECAATVLCPKSLLTKKATCYGQYIATVIFLLKILSKLFVNVQHLRWGNTQMMSSKDIELARFMAEVWRMNDERNRRLAAEKLEKEEKEKGR
jgi:hypothetical protein